MVDTHYKQEPPNFNLKSHPWRGHTSRNLFPIGTPYWCYTGLPSAVWIWMLVGTILWFMCYCCPLVVVQLLSHMWLLVTLWTAACQASLSFTTSWTLHRLMSIKLVMSSNHLLLYHPIFLLPSIFPSIMLFSDELVLYIRWPKYWSISFSTSPSNEQSGLISFRIDWFNLLAVQVTLKSLLQNHSLKASILQCSVFFMVQLSHPYMTSGKIISLTRQTFVVK